MSEAEHPETASRPTRAEMGRHLHARQQHQQSTAYEGGEVSGIKRGYDVTIPIRL